MLNRAPASPPQVQSGTIFKIEAQSVSIDTGSGKVQVPINQFQLDGRPVQVQELNVQMPCVQEGGMWQVQPSESSLMKPGFSSQMGPKAGPGISPLTAKLGPPTMPNIAQPGAPGGPPKQEQYEPNAKRAS